MKSPAEILDKFARISALTGVLSITALLLYIPFVAGLFWLSGKRIIFMWFLLLPLPLIWFPAKKQIQLIFPKTGDKVPSGRIAGACKGLIAGLGFLLLIQFFCCFSAGSIPVMFFKRYFFLIALAVIILCTGAGVFLPLKEEPRRRGWIPAGILCLIPVNLFAAAVLAVVPVNFQCSGYRDSSYFLSAETVRKTLPWNADRIKLEGESMLFCHYFNWICHVGEKDFLAFAEENGYELAENDICHNTNPETHKADVRWLLKFMPDECKKKLPESFYIYVDTYRNNGGWVMLYDRKLNILYGHYSSM